MTEPGASITLDILRFVSGAPSEPEFRWRVWPAGSRFTDAELREALSAMKKPAAVMVHVEPGGLTALPLPDAGGSENQARHQREWANQRDYLRGKLTHLGVRDDATPILVELDQQAALISAAELENWAREYVVPSCGGTVQRTSDPRASIRFVVVRADGTWSTGFESGGCAHGT